MFLPNAKTKNSLVYIRERHKGLRIMMRKMVIFIYGSLLVTFLLWTVGCAGSSQTVSAKDQAATAALAQSNLSSPPPVPQAEGDNVPRIKADEEIGRAHV